MGRRGRRTRIAPGIYSDDTGYAAIVNVGTMPPRERRFPRTADFRADLARMQRWQLRTKAALIAVAERRRRSPGGATLGDSVPRFLATIEDGSSARRDYEKLLLTWLATPLATMDRATIRRSDVQTQLAAWLAEGYSASTLNHRLRALRKLFDVLDGDDEYAVNPCAKIPKFPEPEPEERGASYDILEGILSYAPDVGFSARGHARPRFNKSKIRLRVMAWTGLPPALVKRIRPEHVHWAERELDVMPRRKGKGVKARRLPLLEEAVAALRDMAAANAWGSYSNAAPWNTWDRAKRRYLAALRATGAGAETFETITRIVEPLRPYDLRHSFATMVLESTGNRHAVSDLLIHASLQTSQRYVKRAVITVSRAAIAAVAEARRLAAAATDPVPCGAIVTGDNARFPETNRGPVDREQSPRSTAKREVTRRKRAS